MLQIQEDLVVNIKQLSGACDAKLRGLIEFFQSFHAGEAWNAGHIEAHQFSLSEVFLESSRVLRNIKNYPVNRIGLTSISNCNDLLAALSTVSGVLDNLRAVQSTLQAETRALTFLSFMFKTKIGEEDVVNIGNLTVNLYDSVEYVKGVAARFAFFQRSEPTTEEELAQIGLLIQKLKAVNAESDARVVQMQEAKEQLEAAIAAALSEKDASLAAVEEARMASLAGSQEIEVHRTEAKNLRDSASSLVEAISAKRGEADEILSDAKTAAGTVHNFSEEVEDLKLEIENIKSSDFEYNKTQEMYLNKVHDLIEQANAMVSGATNAGLAKAFLEERNLLDRGMKITMRYFFAGIVFIFVATLFLAAYVLEFPLSIGQIQLAGKGLTPQMGDEITIAGVISRTILLIAPFWLTLFSARRYQSLFDLRQQYSHKYNMAFSVDGFEQQAPSYKESIVAWVFQIVSEAPVNNHRKKGRGMGESPFLSWVELIATPQKKFEALLKLARDE